MEKEHQDFIQEAIDLATENVLSGNGGPFGALVVKQGKIVGKGVNTVTTGNDPTAHAEVNAIRDACRNLQTFQLSDCILYTSCEPCPMCLGAIYWARPEKVYYAATKTEAAEAGFDDSFIYDELKLAYEDRKIPFICIRNGRVTAAFDAWRNKDDKTPY